MPAKPDILVLGNFLSSSGSSRGVCEDLAVRLEHAGWQVTTASNRPGRIARLIDFIRTISGQRNRYQIASIDTFSGLAFTWAEICAFLLRRLNKPFVMVLHGGNLPVFARRHPLRVGRVLSTAAQVTAPSRYLQEQMRAYRPDLILMPNPIDLERYPFVQRTVCAPRLVWLRAFHDIYNPSLAIRAAAGLQAQYPQLRLLMVGGDKGDGSLQASRRLAEGLGVFQNVEFVGSVPHFEVPSWLQKGDIFINTTHIDNTPVSVLEAMACGLCVISTNVGGIPYLLEHEKDALLVPPDDPAAMSAAVQRILSEPDLAASISKNGRKKVEQFDWSVILPQWEKLFYEILSS